VKTLELTDVEFDWLSESVKLMQNIRNGLYVLCPGDGLAPLLAGSTATIGKIDSIFDSIVTKLEIEDYYKSAERKYDDEI
jgi:aminopeptidase-like protein